jgi:hypothetical protein
MAGHFCRPASYGGIALAFGLSLRRTPAFNRFDSGSCGVAIAKRFQSFPVVLAVDKPFPTRSYRLLH